MSHNDPDRSTDGSDGVQTPPAQDDVQAPPAQERETPTESSPAGGQVGQRVQTAPSFGSILQRPGVQDQLKYVVGTYAVLGVGFGLLGIVATEFIGGGGFGSSILGSMVLFVAVAVGPITALLFGLRLDDALAGSEPMALYTASAVANAVGYFVMVFVAGILLSSGGTGPGDLLVAGILLGIVVGAIAAGLGYVQRSLA